MAISINSRLSCQYDKATTNITVNVPKTFVARTLSYVVGPKMTLKRTRPIHNNVSININISMCVLFSCLFRLFPDLATISQLIHGPPAHYLQHLHKPSPG